MRILIDLDDKTVKKIEEEAKKEKRPRKLHIEKILSDHSIRI